MYTNNVSRLILPTFLACLFSISLAFAATGPKPGQIAPDFTLKKLTGGKTSLAELRKNGHVMLIFWEPNCVYCYSHIQDFNALHEKYLNKGLTVAAINFLGEYDEEIAEYVKDNNVKYLMLSDRLNNIDVAEAYRVVGSPTIVVIAPDGKVVFYGYKIPDVIQWVK
jgi:cytochrome c biogenesis protein CcmG/thiol:disulfide interchange protein DsbE